MRCPLPFSLLLLCSLAIACSAEDDASAADAAASADGGDSTDGGGQADCSYSTAVAQFSITSRDDYGGFSGAYHDYPWPQILMEHVRVGDCAFYAPEPSFCDPQCTDGVCAVGGVCAPWPQNLSAGVLSVTGTSPSLEVEQQPGGSYYTPDSYPNLYAPGDEITLSGPGAGDVAPFSLDALGVPRLVIPWENAEAVEHQAMEVTWDTAESPTGTRVIIHLDNDHHGTAAYVECMTDDTGSVTIDSAVLDPLIDAGRTGIGTFIENAYMARVNGSATNTSSGCVGFRSESMFSIYVDTVTAD